MQNNNTTSVNIIRDTERNLNYHPTPNAQRVAYKLTSDFSLGKRSFNIIGSYGTGKSAFLWALQQSILGKKHYLTANFLPDPKVEIINLIGEFKSFEKYLAEYFDVENTDKSYKQIFAAIFQRYHNLGKSNPLLIIIVDEFGKFLEYAAKNSPEKELYFMQLLAEFVNNSENNIILLTTVHQNIDAYAFSLSGTQRQEWTKIKGRFEEITFNEPVEQLIYLASETISQSVDVALDSAEIQKVNEIFICSRAFKINLDFMAKISHKIFPMELLSAYVLTLALQKYGQNERSLFSFLTNMDRTGLYGFDRRTNPFYNLANVYDYLIFNFYAYLNSPSNPDFTEWSKIKDALERVEHDNQIEVENQQKIIKSIGLLSIFASKGAIFEDDFIENYAITALGFNPTVSLNKLEQTKIIIYRKYINRFVLFQGTDIDLQSALAEAAINVGDIKDVSGLLNGYFQLPSIFAKRHYYQTGTPRIFEFKISHNPKYNLALHGEIDGFINLVFNETFNIDRLKELSAGQEEAILYGCYKNLHRIKDLIFEIEKTKKAIENIPTDDKIAHRELNDIKSHQERLLSHYIVDNLYTTDVQWVFQGEVFVFKNKREFNIKLSEICDRAYPYAPIYKNELVNRNRLSSSIFTAKRQFILNLVQHWNSFDMGYQADRFPPEKTIYITLLKQNGLVPNIYDTTQSITLNKDSAFKKLWDCCELFLQKSKKDKLKISELITELQKPPFKLKQGLIDFWIPSFLYIKRNDYALFNEGVFLPFINEGTLELINKNPDEYEIKCFDVEGVRLDIFNSYRSLLNQSEIESAGNITFIETLRPFFKFYRDLPDYSKHTKRLANETIAVRSAIVNSKDPEKTFFEDFPQSLGYSLVQLQENKQALESYVSSLQSAIRELRSSYAELNNRFELFICNEIIYQKLEYNQYKTKLQNQYKSIKKHLLLPVQKTFLMRLESQIEEKEAWFSSIVQALINKPLKQITDEEELALFSKLKNIFIDLDSLTHLSEEDYNEEKEEVFKLEITTFGSSAKKAIKFPKQKGEVVNSIETELKKQLGEDKTLNIVALANVLKELINQ